MNKIYGPPMCPECGAYHSPALEECPIRDPISVILSPPMQQYRQKAVAAISSVLDAERKRILDALHNLSRLDRETLEMIERLVFEENR